MAIPDMKKIIELKKAAMKRCEDRINEAASRPPCQKNHEETPEYGVTIKLKKKYGL